MLTDMLLCVDVVVVVFQAVWLPGSQTELAIVTADFVKVSGTHFCLEVKLFSVCVCVYCIVLLFSF